MAQAEAQMSTWFKANPDATPDKVEIKMGEILRSHKAGKAAGTILLAPPAAKAPRANGPVDWTRYLKDAPSTTPAPDLTQPLAAGAPFSQDDDPPPGPPPPSVRPAATKQQRIEDAAGALLDLEPQGMDDSPNLLPDIGFDEGIYDRSPQNPENRRTR
jgi:hypothetical protein